MKSFPPGINRLLTVQGRILYKIALAALALAVVAFVYQEFVLHTWTRTDATITGANASYALDPNSTTCTADYRLSYKVGEKEYLATERVRASADCAVWGRQIEARVGGTEPLLYNSVEPSAIYLHPGYNSEFFFLPLLLSGLAAGLAALGFFSIRLSEWSDMERATEVDLSFKAPARASRPVPAMRKRA